MMHLDHRDTDRVRTRAHFLSEDAARSSSHDPLRNWFDAEREEERVLLDVLGVFPQLSAAYSRAALPPSLATCYVGYLLRAKRDEDVDFGLADLDAMLDALVARFGHSALHEQFNDLFIATDATLSEVRWVKAVTETYALAHLHAIGRLASLGWPPPLPGTSGTPPFDCRIDVSGVPLACDVKPASGSGYSLVRDALRPIVEKWASAHSIGNVDLFIHYRGTIAQQVLGPALRSGSGVLQFESELCRHSSLPSNAIPLALDTTTFDVTVALPGSGLVSGGMQATAPLVSALVPTLLKHIRQKSQGAASNGNAPFLLCYVRLPGSGGGDLKASDLFRDLFAQAANSLGVTNILWLGVLLLDYVNGSPRSTCFLRSSAAWPPSVTPDSLAVALSSALELI